MTTEAERDCEHGQLARSCNVCELESEVARQAAEIERLKASWTTATILSRETADLNDRLAAERDKSNALLRQALEALESCYEGDYSTGHVIDPSFDSVAVDNSIAAIKQHLEQT